MQPGGHRFDPGQLHQIQSLVVGYWSLAKTVGLDGNLDFILELLGELLFEPLLTGLPEFMEFQGSGEWERLCRVQTLFGNDVWWNS